MGKILYKELQDKVWLHSQYVEQGKTMRVISDELGTSACVVLDALRKFELPIRDKAYHIRGTKFTQEHRTRISLAHKGKSKEWQIGEKNSNWQGGRTSQVQLGRSTALYKKWKEDVFNRDIFCVSCGSTALRVAHHIKPYQEFPELRFSVENGVVLCRSCHSTYHNSASVKKGLIRRTPQEGNAEPATAIA